MRLIVLIAFASVASPSLANDLVLEDWNISDWGPDRRAACGVSLVVDSGLLFLAMQADEGREEVLPEERFNTLFQVASRGYTYNTISKKMDPKVNEIAWGSPKSKDRETSFKFLSRCIKFFNADVREGRITEEDIENGTLEMVRFFESLEQG